jgi:hypothetical protein
VSNGSSAVPKDVYSSMVGINPTNAQPGIPLGATPVNPNELLGSYLYYDASLPGDTGQITLYCDPRSTTP